MTVVLGTKTGEVCRYLQKNGIPVSACTPKEIPSLTALVLQQPEVENIALLDEAEQYWSMGHILAAAKQLQGKGRMIFVGDHGKLPALITVVPDKEALLEILKKPANPTGTGGKVMRHAPPAPACRTEIAVRPLEVPPGKILMLGVIGSQHRIGCTTQAVGLWHYCRALGFDAAIVSSPAQIAQIAGAMQHEQIQGGYRIEGIPFITDTAQAYDCYILDIGPDNIQQALSITDHLILVAGSKPWELQHTAAALRAARGKEMLILLSFSSQSDAKALQPLFGRQTVTTLPWMPELWHPSMDAMAIYDVVLRPVLERLLSRCEPQLEDEPAG